MVHWSLPVTCIKVSPCYTETQSFVEHTTHSCVPRVQGRKFSAVREVVPGRLGQQVVVVHCATAAVLAYKMRSDLVLSTAFC